MWELYAAWSFIAIFFFDFFLVRGANELRAGSLSGLVGFAVIGMGAAGSVLAGTWADRLGRERVTIWAMAISGACALLIGWLLQHADSRGGGVALIRLRSRIGSESGALRPNDAGSSRAGCPRSTGPGGG